MQKRIGLAQIDIDIYHPDRNIAKMKQIICDHRKADLIVFPELVVHGHIYSSAQSDRTRVWESLLRGISSFSGGRRGGRR